MKHIFNSLGSNYNLAFAFGAVRRLFFPNRKDGETLKSELEQRFGGEARLFYKGRDAIQYALWVLGIGQGDEVLTQALTCYAIEEAILRTGARPVFVDVEENKVNLSVESLKSAMVRSKKPRAVIIQNTLGIPADIEKISRWCKESDLALIEDLAQSLGAIGAGGKPVGSHGDAVVLSFGRDKIVDAVAGGAAILRKKAVRTFPLGGEVGMGVVFRDMVYPILTWKIRKTYVILVGKLIAKISRSVRLITSAVASPTQTATPLPSGYAGLARLQLKRLDEEIAHRRRISGIYFSQLRNKNKFLITGDEVERGANLRFAFTTENPQKLINHLEKKGVHLSDRWYRAPVDSGTLGAASVYREGSCPNAEKLSGQIMNLPTHRNVSEADAVRITDIINHFLK
jgi:dTDP-4-amino-4,6-dideoxygalactose transaminase